MESIFLNKIDQIIIENIDNENLGVSDIADQLSLSRFQLLRKLKKLTGKSVGQYIREFRLQKAYDLLKEKEVSVSEVAYSVGFSSPSYFTKCFQEYYGKLPSKIDEIADNVADGSSFLDPDQATKKHPLHFIFDQPWKLMVHAILFIVIIGLVGVFFYQQFRNSTSILEGNKSLLFLPAQVEGGPIQESVLEEFNLELRQYIKEKTGMNTMYYSFDRRKIRSENQLLELGSELNVDYIVDLQFLVHIRDSSLILKIYNMDPKRSHTTWKLNSGLSLLKEDCLLALDEFIELEQLYIDNTLDYFGNSTNDKEVLNEKFKMAKLYFNLYRNTSFIEDYRIAKDMASLAIKEDPDNIELIFLLGQLLSEAHLLENDTVLLSSTYDSILILADKAIEIDSNYSVAYQLEALYEITRSHWGDANEKFEMALQYDSTAFLSYRQLGWNNLGQDPTNALEYWQLLDKYDRDKEMFVTSTFQKALIFNGLGDIQTADSLFDLLLKLAPENIMYRTISLWHDIGQGRFEEVRNKVDQLCKGDPECPLGHFYLESYLGEGNYQDAITYLNNSYRGFGWVNSRSGDRPCSQCDRLQGYIYWKLGDKEKAESILIPYITNIKALYKTSGGFDRANYTWDLALTFAVMDEYEQSLEYLFKLEEVSPYYPNYEWTKRHAVFQPLHDLPEYHELIIRVDNRRRLARLKLNGDPTNNRLLQ